MRTPSLDIGEVRLRAHTFVDDEVRPTEEKLRQNESERNASIVEMEGP
jgi:hypothetical protein